MSVPESWAAALRVLESHAGDQRTSQVPQEWAFMLELMSRLMFEAAAEHA